MLNCHPRYRDSVNRLVDLHLLFVYSILSMILHISVCVREQKSTSPSSHWANQQQQQSFDAHRVIWALIPNGFGSVEQIKAHTRRNLFKQKHKHKKRLIW